MFLLASVPGLPLSMRVLITHRRQTFFKCLRLRIIKTRKERGRPGTKASKNILFVYVFIKYLYVCLRTKATFLQQKQCKNAREAIHNFNVLTGVASRHYLATHFVRWGHSCLGSVQ